MTLTKFRIIARRRWPLVVLAGVLCLGAAFLVAVATEDDSSSQTDAIDPDSYVATGVVGVDRSQLFDPNLDLGLAILEVDDAGLYEEADEELGLPGGPDALRGSTQIFPGTIPGSTTQDELEETNASDPNAAPANEAILIQVSNLDGETATLQADVLASTWATIANRIDQDKLAGFTATIGQQIAVVEEQLLAFDQANPRIALLPRPVEPGDAFLMAQRQGLQTQLDGLTQALTGRSSTPRTSPAFDKLPTQEAQPASQLGISQDTTTEKLTSFTVDWVLPVVVGLLLALGLVFLLEKLFPRVDTSDDIQDELGIPVLAEVPRVRTAKSLAPHSLADLHGPDAEMYRSLRSSLEFIAASAHETPNGATNGNGHRRSEVIMIVSPTPSEGKTRSAAYLGLTYAEAGHDVAIFGCDFRRPKLHDYFGVERDPGLGSLVANGSVDLDDVVKRTDVDGLSVVPSGEPTNKTVPIVDTVSELIDEARASGVDVIIDTAPLLVANDAADLVEFADHVVMVVRAGKTHLNAAKEALEVLKRHDAPIAGVVVVASHPADGGYYSYYRRYGYYEHEQNGTKSRLPWRRGGRGDRDSEPEAEEDGTS